VGQPYPIYLATCLLVFYFHQARRCFHPDFSRDFWHHQAFLYRNGYGSHGSIAAHGQATTGLYKQDSKIVCGICWRVQDAAAHHIVSPGLEHQAFADPVELLYEMLAFFAHIGPYEVGSPTCNYTYRIPTGMGIYTKKCFSGHWFERYKDPGYCKDIPPAPLQRGNRFQNFISPLSSYPYKSYLPSA